MRKHNKLFKIALIPLLLLCFLSVGYSPTAQAQSTLDDGLVGYWNFNEIGGNAVEDISGNNNNGQIYNNPLRIEGYFDRAISFDNDNDYISISSNMNLESFDGLTVSYWLNYSASSPDFSNFFSKTSINARWLSFYHEDNIYFNLKNDSGTVGQVNILVPFDEWNLLTCTFNGTYLNLYLNAELVNSASFTGVMNISEPLIIGDISTCFRGILDDFRVYDRSLTSAEIIELYNYDPDFVEPTPTSTPFVIYEAIPINYLNSAALIFLAIVCIALTIKPSVPILNFIFGVIVIGISAATAGQSDMLLFGYLPILTVILAIVCMLSGYSNWKH